MSDIKTYDFSKPEEFSQFFEFVSYLKEKGATVELKEIKKTRSYQQNRALHLYFQFCADALNDHGLYFRNMDLFGLPVEKQWTTELVKEFIWRPIQKTLFDIDSTTKLKTNELDSIIDVITNHFSKIEIRVDFPCQFDYWLKQSGY